MTWHDFVVALDKTDRQGEETHRSAFAAKEYTMQRQLPNARFAITSVRQGRVLDGSAEGRWRYVAVQQAWEGYKYVRAPCTEVGANEEIHKDNVAQRKAEQERCGVQ